MAEEDEARENLSKALMRVRNLPRPSIVDDILWDTMRYCAALLNIKLEEPKP